MKRTAKKFFFFIFLFLASCGPSSVRDLRAEGESETLKLSKLLHEIDTKDDLQRNLSKVKKSYCRIADLILQVREFHDLSSESEPSEASDRLFAELARLYEMPGCRDLIESSQEEALSRLNR